ncbi:MAG: hypothetical protein P8075_12565 [Deltaproteobacteria bacterium]
MKLKIAGRVELAVIILTRIFHALLSRDHEDGRACPPSRALRRGGLATWQPQGIDSEPYLNGTSQGPTPEDAGKDAYIRGRSHARA